MKHFKNYLLFLAIALFVGGGLALAIHISSRKAEAAGTVPTVTFLPATDPNNGEINGGELKISGSGPFTEDFRVELCLRDAEGAVGTQCIFTPWASQAADAGTSQISDGHNVPEYTAANASTWWSAWGGSAGSGPWLQPPGLPYITIQTQPLAAEQVIDNVQLGIQFVENNSAVQGNGPQCLSVIGGGGQIPIPDTGVSPDVIAHPDSAEYTPIGGGVSAANVGYSASSYGSYPAGYAYGWTNENCSDPAALSDTPNYFRIYLSADNYNASGVSDNTPSNFNVSQSVTTGTNGSPLEITIKNTGTAPWVSDQSTVIAGTQSGTCDAAGNACPALTHPQGTSCTVSVDNYSDVFELQHTSGSFNVGSNPAQYQEVTKNTCAVGASSCSNPAPACETSASACESGGQCSVGSCNTASTCQTPSQDGGCGGEWIDVCDGTWGPQYTTSVSGKPNVAPGASVQFELQSLKAPASAGTYADTWQMTRSGSLFGFPYSVTTTVGIPSSTVATGTITFTSENYKINSVLVPASWDILSAASFLHPNGTDICDGTGVTCSGTSVKYTGQSAMNASDTKPGVVYSVVSSTVVAATNYSKLYSLNSIQQVPVVAAKIGTLQSLLALSRNMLVSTANAWSVPATNPLNQTLMPTRTVQFIILWYPIANMQVSPPAAALTATAGGSATSSSVTITNTGAPGSTLTWNTSIAYSSGSGWLKASPASGSLTNAAAGNAAATPAITANPAALAAGTYKATVTVTGTSAPGTPPKGITPETITITFTVKAPVPTVTSVVPTCTPASVFPNGTSSCTAVVNGTNGPSQAVTWSMVSGPGSINKNSGIYTAGATTGTAKVQATSVADPTKSGTATIAVTNTGTGIAVSANCNPSSITVNGTSSCTATVTGTANQSVVWSVVSGGGSINAAGVYTAPGATTTAMIQAVSAQDMNASDTATVSVTASGGAVTGVSVVCSPSSILTTQTSNCAATVAPPAANQAVTWSMVSGPGLITPSSSNPSIGIYTPPSSVSATTAATVQAISVQDSTQSGASTITISAAPLPPPCTGNDCPICTNPALDANPSGIVVPESSSLGYSCQNVTSCTLTGNDGSDYSSALSYIPDTTYSGSTAIAPVSTASGTQSVVPANTTVYTLSCMNANYSGSAAQVTSTVQVTVNGSSYCEQNPNGAGCPQ